MNKIRKLASWASLTDDALKLFDDIIKGTGEASKYSRITAIMKHNADFVAAAKYLPENITQIVENSRILNGIQDSHLIHMSICERIGIESPDVAMNTINKMTEAMNNLKAGTMNEEQFIALFNKNKDDYIKSVEYFKSIASLPQDPVEIQKIIDAIKAQEAAAQTATQTATKTTEEATEAIHPPNPSEIPKKPATTETPAAEAPLSREQLKDKKLSNEVILQEKRISNAIVEEEFKSVKTISEKASFYWNNAKRLVTGLFSITRIAAMLGITAIALGVGYYYYSKDPTESIISCFDNLNISESSYLARMRAEIISDFNQMQQAIKAYNLNPSDKTLEALAEDSYNKLLANHNGKVFLFVKQLFLSPQEAGGQEQVNKFIECLQSNISPIVSQAEREISRRTQNPNSSSPSPTRNSPQNQAKASISIPVQLASGEYNVNVTTTRESIPQKFVLYVNAMKPFFASATFAAFVDPDPGSPLGGYGLVPNSIGMTPIENRIANAIKYCYNNNIKTEHDLTRHLIKQINSGIPILRKIFKNEPEQEVLRKTINFYKLNKMGNFMKSTNLNKTADKDPKNNKKIYQDAAKGLKDKSAKDYYKELDMLYNEKPKKKETDLKNLYNVSEKDGFDEVLEAHSKSSIVADSMGNGGLVENGLEAQKKTVEIMNKVPSGNYHGKYAKLIRHLQKMKKLAEQKQDVESIFHLDETINKFKEK